MNILYVEHYAGGDRFGMEFRPFYFAREWSRAGHDVTILAADYSHLRKTNPTPQKDFEEQMVEGVRYVWVKTNPYHGNGVGRVRNILTFLHKINAKRKQLVEKYKPDIVIASSTYPMDAKPAWRMARLSGGCFCYEIHDLWPMTPMIMGGVSAKNPLIAYMQHYEDLAFEKSDAVVSILPDADKHMAERGFSTEKFVHIPNGVVLNNGAAPEEIPEQHRALLDALKEQGKFIVMYAGGHAVSNALDTFVKCGKGVNADTALVLLGGGVEKPKLIELAKQLGVTNVHFLDPVNKQQVPGVLCYADAMYVGAKKCALYQYGVGINKVFDYMLAAKPILYAVDSSNNPVLEAGCGVFAQPESEEALVHAINSLRNLSEEERRAMGENGRQYVMQNHDYTKLAADFTGLMEKLLHSQTDERGER